MSFFGILGTIHFDIFYFGILLSNVSKKIKVLIKDSHSPFRSGHRIQNLTMEAITKKNLEIELFQAILSSYRQLENDVVNDRPDDGPDFFLRKRGKALAIFVDDRM